MKKWLLIGLAITLLGISAFAYSGPPKWLIYPVRDSLISSTDEDIYLVVYKGGKVVHVKASGFNPFSPQIELYDGAGTLIGADYAQPGDYLGEITMPLGGTVTNILYLHVKGRGAGSYPAIYTAWNTPIF